MKTINIRIPNAELQKMAVDELNENPKKVYNDIQELKTWLSKQNHIKARTDDQFLVAFLRGCKYSLERSKEKLDAFYTIRTAIPEFFDNRNAADKKLQDVMSMGLTLPLPNIEHNTAPRIMLIRQAAFDPNIVSVADVIKISYMITDTLLWEDDNTVIAGQSIIVDLKGFSMAHISQFSAVLIKKMTSSIQEAYPIRQKGIHFINSSGLVETLYKIFYSFMSKKLKKRLFVHENMESLHRHIPKKLLPTEYGGEAGSVQTIADSWKTKLIANSKWFADDALYKTDESKRVEKAKNGNLLFGTDGSFRSLDID